MGINQKPYPPIVDDWNPVAIRGEDIRIYFSLSAYNSIYDIRQDVVLVDIVDINNNSSVVDTTYNKGFQLVEEFYLADDGSYYIEIPQYKVTIDSGRLYKVQLRFVSQKCSAPRDDFLTIDYYQQIDYISDFSKVALLKIISRPTLELNGFPEINTTVTYLISTPSLMLSGKLKFAEEDDDECLASYNIKIYENYLGEASTKDTLFLNSGIIFPDTRELNLINFLVKKDLTNRHYYLLAFTYTTKSGYTNTEYYNFTTIYEAETPTLPPVIETTLDKEDGSVIVKIFDYNLSNPDDRSYYSGYMVLRRSSSIDNFLTWEEMRYFKYKNEIINEEIKDYTVQAGVIYRYQVIPINWIGYRGVWGEE